MYIKSPNAISIISDTYCSGSPYSELKYSKYPASQNINTNIRNTAICIFLGSSAKNVNIPHAAVDSISMYINAKYAILYVVSSREVILFATKFITLDAFMIINCGDEYISSFAVRLTKIRYLVPKSRTLDFHLIILFEQIIIIAVVFIFHIIYKQYSSEITVIGKSDIITHIKYRKESIKTIIAPISGNILLLFFNNSI